MSSLLEQASLVVTPNGTKASKLYSVKPTDGSGDMTVVRATTATRVNSSGLIESSAVNVPRLDYTGSTCPSLLVEPQRTNLLLRSEELDNASWVKLNLSSTSNSTISPSGVTNADSLIENTTNGLHITYQTITTTATTYSYSCYIKPDTRTRAYLRTDISSGTVRTLFDLTGAGSVVTLAHTSATITNVGNGWYRCSVTFTEGTGAGRLFVIEAAVGTSISYTGNGLNAFYLWGAQLEAGANATSYIPTTTASVTRNADVISKTGISSLIGQTEGTLFIDFIPTERITSRYISLESASGISGGWMGIFSDANPTYKFRFFGDGFSFYSINEIQLNERYKVAFSYKNGVLTSAYINGVSQGTLTANTTSKSYADFKIATAAIGSRGDGKYKQITLFNTALTNTELATLTTL